MKSYVTPAQIYKKLEDLEETLLKFVDRPLSRKEAAEQLGIHVHTLDRKIREGLIKCTKTADGVRYIPQSEINNYALNND